MSNIDFKTEDKKELVLKDIYSRLPYGVMVRVEVNDVFIKPTDEVATVNTISMFDYPQKFRVTPYLRPMSSMTEEEKRELTNTTQYDTCYKDDGIDCIYQHILGWEIQGRITIHNVGYSTIDWLNEHHFDYRGLIEKGLALEAPDGMYK